MEFLAGVHPKVILFIYGALFGLPATALAIWLTLRGQSWAKFLPFPFIILGVFIGNNGGFPMLMNLASPPKTMCQELTSLADSRNAQYAGTNLDAVTRLSEIHADCDAAMLVFAYQVTMAAASFSPSDVDALQDDVNKACDDENSEPLFRAGWNVQKQYLTADDLTLRFTAECGSE